jgi:acetyl esterase/lipase
VNANAATTPAAKPRRKLRRALAIVTAVLLGLLAFFLYASGGFVRLGPPIPKTHDYLDYDNIDYLEGDGPADPWRQLDLRLPLGVESAPIVGILHGGGWASATRRDGHALAEWLAERGVIGATIDYPLVPAATTVEQAQAAARATAWLARHAAEFGGDPRRIFLLGHSAGGQLAALIACDRQYLDAVQAPPTVPAGVITMCAPFDLRAGPKAPARWTQRMVHRAFGDDPQFRWAMSPQAHVRPGLPPFLMIRAKMDRLVILPQSEEMAAAIRAAGGSVETLTVSGREHVSVFYRITQPGDQASAAVLRFVKKQ